MRISVFFRTNKTTDLPLKVSNFYYPQLNKLLLQKYYFTAKFPLT